MAEQTSPRYLVVANQTAQSTELIKELKRLAVEEKAEFILLVPATPVQHALTWDENESRTAAREVAEQARTRYEEEGLTVSAVEVGPGSPVLAIEDELETHPNRYSGVVLSTLPLGISRWLRLDVVSAVRSRTRLPVTHIVSTTPAAIAR